jgi:hypothetical protein
VIMLRGRKAIRYVGIRHRQNCTPAEMYRRLADLLVRFSGKSRTIARRSASGLTQNQ